MSNWEKKTHSWIFHSRPCLLITVFPYLYEALCTEQVLSPTFTISIYLPSSPVWCIKELLLFCPFWPLIFFSFHRSSWELPELREGRVKAISDSDGVSYPWYGNTTETVTLSGPTSKPSRLTVSMNDNFYPSVTWAVPISNSNTPMLTHITRDQSFITWLVALNADTKERIVLQTVRWRMRVDIEVDPSMPLGSRAKLMGRPHQEQPHILSNNEPIPPNALGRPNANDAQVLMWRPRRGQPLVVIPPK